MRKLALFILGVVALSSCSECTDCEPFAEEPYLQIRFYNASDSSAQIVVIDSVNHVWAGSYEYYQDTVNTYKLPLNMQADISDFTLTFRDTTDYTTFLTRELSVSYERSYVKREDNNIIVKSNIVEVTSNFSNANLECGDTLTCISNDALYKIYR